MHNERTLDIESSLAARLAKLRGDRSYKLLSDELAASTGHRLAPSALHKIERGEPRRKITVDDLVAFSEYYKVPVLELLQPELSAVSPVNAGAGHSELRGTVEELRSILRTMLTRYGEERKTLDDLSSVVRSLRALEGPRAVTPDGEGNVFELQTGSLARMEDAPEDELMCDDADYRDSVLEQKLTDILTNAPQLSAEVRKYLEDWRDWIDENR